uniref:EamA domain-containing protein n=1 Tax=Entomoneis paludosa TaxID=265537 RepID=A0A6U2X4T5_9STRA
MIKSAQRWLVALILLDFLVLGHGFRGPIRRGVKIEEGALYHTAFSQNHQPKPWKSKCMSLQHHHPSFERGAAGASPKLVRIGKFMRGGAVTLAATATGGPPPMKAWLGTALLCALSYALYNLFIKRASTSIDPILGGVLLQFVAALLGTLLLVVKQVLMKNVQPMKATERAGLWWAVAAGLAVGTAEILSFIISSMGVQAMQSIPVIM